MRYLLESNKNQQLFFQASKVNLRSKSLVYDTKSNFGSLNYQTTITTLIYTNKSNIYFFKQRVLKSIIVQLQELGLSIKDGYFIDLLLVGLGYKVLKIKKTQMLYFELHFSHKLFYKIPLKVSIRCIKKKLVLFSLSKIELINTAEAIKSLRFPNTYKGKGIKYLHEVLKLKPGKQR